MRISGKGMADEYDVVVCRCLETARLPCNVYPGQYAAILEAETAFGKFKRGQMRFDYAQYVGILPVHIMMLPGIAKITCRQV